jgi:hypothetical protein
MKKNIKNIAYVAAKGFRNLTSRQPVVLVTFVLILYLLKSAFLSVHISSFHTLILLLTVGIHAIAVRFIYRSSTIREVVKSLIISYILIAFSLAASSLIYDYSYDGQAYHQGAAIALANGWNPYYDIQSLNPSEWSCWRWVNYYPKFTWTYASVLKSVFNNTEVGKSYNILFFTVAALYTLKMVSKCRGKNIFVLLASFVIMANPVVLQQMFTYYVDGLMAMCMLLLIFSLMDFEEEQKYIHLLMALAVSVFMLNLKFSGFICGVVIMGYVAKSMLQKKWKNSVALAGLGMSALLIGALLTGFNPYVTNYLYYGHPFHPLLGNANVDIITSYLPPWLHDANYVERFASLFLFDVGNLRYIPFNPLKINGLGNSTQMNTWAPFGLFFAEICLLILCSIFGAKNSRRGTVVFASIMLLVSTLVFPENWNGRYVPYFWYAPCLLLCFANFEKRKVLAWLIASLTLINISPFVLGTWTKGIINTISLNRLYNDIKQADKEDITIVLEDENFLISTKEKMKEHKVNKNITFSTEEKMNMHGGYSRTRVKAWY